ncbi:prepilin peptidase [Bacillus sp. B190/17]|uniref:Prepilin peptidase n=1 Tax=Bacillus lumedeiriae TaxID=3058829 RepID=A0ABW8I4W4_9BACI
MIFIFFLYGLVFGSFFNLVGIRVPVGRSVMTPRSMCTACNHLLTARELIPVVSYVWQNRSCRVCCSPISPLYPFVEIITACLFAFAYAKFGFQLPLLKALTLISLLMIIFVSDIVYMLIPNKILLFFTYLFLIQWIFLPASMKMDVLLAGVMGGGLLILMAAVCKGGIGGGDIKLFILLGFVLGLKEFLVTFILSVWLGALGGLLGMMLGKVKRGQPFPFGPFIVVAALLVLFYGEFIFTFYLSLFHN